MTTDLAIDPKELMAEHLEALRGYARRAIIEGVTLSPSEDRDKAIRVREFMCIGASFGCTGRELVSLLYKDIYKDISRRGCDCSSCRSRKSAGQQPSVTGR